MLSTEYLVNEGSYQKLKEVTSYDDLVNSIDAPGSTSITLRLGRHTPACVKPHPNAFTLALSVDRVYISCYKIDVVADRELRIVYHGLHNDKLIWTMPIEYISPVVFMYYAAPSDSVFEALLDRLCFTATHVH